MKHLMKYEQFTTNLEYDYLTNESWGFKKLKNALAGLLLFVGTATSVSGQTTLDDYMKNPDFNKKYHEVERLVCDQGYSEQDAKEVINLYVASSIYGNRPDEEEIKRRGNRLTGTAKDLFQKTESGTETLWMSPKTNIENLYGPTVLEPDKRRPESARQLKRG